MDTLDNVEAVAGLVTGLVEKVTPDQLGAPTPCAEWTVRDLLEHLVGGGHLFALAASGDPLPDHDGPLPDLLGDDPAAAWAASCAHVEATFCAPGALDRTWVLPFATVPGEIAARIAFADLFVHAWDLARATGQAFEADAALVADVDDVLHLIIGTDRDDHSFGDEVAVDADASAVDRVVAFAGRRPDWAVVPA